MNHSNWVDTFLALADPNRRRMVELLSAGPVSAGELATQFEISAPAVSQHLKALREARLVQVEVRAQQRIYTLAPDGFSEIDQWLDRYSRFWTNKLDNLVNLVAACVPQPVSTPKPTKSKKSKAKHKRRKKS